MAASNKDSNVKINNDENIQIEIENKVLGKGAFGIVYLGKKTDHMKKKVEKIALKEIPKQLNDEESQKALDNEIEICQKLDNTNIVKMIKIEKRSDKNYIVYELCNGGDLRRYMDYFKTFDEELIQYIVIKMCNALFELHRKGVVHHDIKPENILIQLFPDEKQITSEIEEKIEDIKRETRKDNIQNNNQLQNNNQYQTNYNNLPQNNSVYTQNNNSFINNNMNMNTNQFNQTNYNASNNPNLSCAPTQTPMGYISNIQNNIYNPNNPNYLGENNNFNGNFSQPNNCLNQNFNICNMPNNNINYQNNNNINNMNYTTYPINNNVNIANNLINMNNNSNINNYNNNNININNYNNNNINNYNINNINNNINNINQNNINQNNINQNMMNPNMMNQNMMNQNMMNQNMMNPNMMNPNMMNPNMMNQNMMNQNMMNPNMMNPNMMNPNMMNPNMMNPNMMNPNMMNPNMMNQNIINQNNIIQNNKINKNEILKILKKAQFKLSDFGLSKLKPTSSNGNEEANRCGSPLYMSPELFVMETSLRTVEDQKVDIWALGVLAYEMFFGRRPFEAKSIDELSRMYKIGEYYLNLKEPNNKISKEFIEFLNLCLQQDPKKRASADVLKNTDFYNRDYNELKKLNEMELLSSINSLKKSEQNGISIRIDTIYFPKKENETQE